MAVQWFPGHMTKAKKDFEQRSSGFAPEEVPEFKLNKQDNMAIPNILKSINFVTSTSEALRLMKSGGIRVDGEKIDKDYSINTDEFLIQVGKRKFGKIKLT